MTPKLKYEADDGALFDTLEDCLRHETGPAYRRLAGLTVDRILSAIRRDAESIALADAIEAVAREITKKRLADGDRRRRAKDAPATLQIEHAKAAE